MQAQNTLNKLSRRNWLRDTALAATGVALVPSLLTSCTDHVIPEPGGLGITEGELRSAAQNLKNMKDWLFKLHLDQKDYEGDMFLTLQSGKDAPSGWADFIINILVDISVGVITAAAEAATAGALTAVAAVTGELVKRFAFDDSRPKTLKAAYAAFATAQDDLYLATRNSLEILYDDTNDFENLRNRFKEPIDFNGKKYTLKDLAAANFPSENQGTEWVKSQNAALLQSKIYFWNMMFIKAGTLNYTIRHGETYYNDSYHPTHHAQNIYEDNKAYYVRGYYDPSGLNGGFWYRYWYFTFDGRELSDEAAYILFKDGRPGQKLNDNGLFNRDYVFKQFTKEKPNFFGYHEIRSDYEKGPGPGDAYYFDASGDNWDFKGGAFPALVK